MDILSVFILMWQERERIFATLRLDKMKQLLVAHVRRCFSQGVSQVKHKVVKEKQLQYFPATNSCGQSMCIICIAINV